MAPSSGTATTLRVLRWDPIRVGTGRPRASATVAKTIATAKRRPNISSETARQFMLLPTPRPPRQEIWERRERLCGFRGILHLLTGLLKLSPLPLQRYATASRGWDSLFWIQAA